MVCWFRVLTMSIVSFVLEVNRREWMLKNISIDCFMITKKVRGSSLVMIYESLQILLPSCKNTVILNTFIVNSNVEELQNLLSSLLLILWTHCSRLQQYIEGKANPAQMRQFD